MTWLFWMFTGSATAAGAAAGFFGIQAVRAYKLAKVIPDMSIYNPGGAEEKAWNRLQKTIGEKEWNRLKGEGQFQVIAERSGLVYYIKATSYISNIKCEDGHKYCMHLSDPYLPSFPLADHLLAQALMIRNDETAFKKIAVQLG